MYLESELGIIGCGIAGVAAAVYAKRAGLKPVIFEANTLGGQLLFMETVDNYIGLPLGTKGQELATNLRNTLDNLGLQIINKLVSAVNIRENKIVLQTDEANFIVKALIIASGAKFKQLGLKNEDAFLGKGVSYCAVCDGFFFKNKPVAVIGGGNTAVEEALYLSEIASKVFLIHRRDQLRALDYLQKELFSRKNIEVLFNSQINQIKGKDFLESVTIKNSQSNQEKELPLRGLFIAIGVKASTDLYKDIVSLDEGGFILTDDNMKTSHESIWACGDCRKRPLRQLITAASEGAIAAISAYKHIKGHYISS
jgi:thioredoxin reductase (NADPH)